MELTQEQKKVIEHKKGHAVVSAVAGSGKTQTMVLRVKYLLERGIIPHDLLVVMYNKSAQIDFVSRLKSFIGDKADQVQVKTFHSLGYALTQLMTKKSYLKQFKLATQSWQNRNLVQKSLENIQKNGILKEEITPELIDQYENYLTLIKSDISNLDNQNNLKNMFGRVEYQVLKHFYELYERFRIDGKIRTFDDLIHEPISYLSENLHLKSEIKWQVPYLIIDEYQDINSAQQSLIKLFINEKTQIMVVGDVDQTIYEWRGSKPYYMLKGFQKEFGDVTYYNLSNTFRYGHKLSLAANSIISQNKERLKSLCISHKITPKTEIDISFSNEIDQLPKKIDHWLKANPGTNYQDIAVLVRKYSSAALFELALLKAQIPYQILGNLGVTHREVTLSMAGYLSLWNQCEYLKKLENNERRKVIQAMIACPSLYLKQSILEPLVTQLTKEPETGAQTLLKLASNYHLKPYQTESIRNRAYLWQDLVSEKRDIQTAKLLETIIDELDYIYYFKSKKYTLNEAFDNHCICESILHYAQSIKLSIAQFLSHFNELKEKAASNSLNKNHQGISILSIHRAKGLEWQKVILLDMTEKAFFSVSQPHLNQNTKKDSSEESERRLFYVAMTRAKKHLTILGGQDKLKLFQWYQSKRKGYPIDLKPTDSLRFLYEMNYQEISEFINSLENNNIDDLSGVFRGKLFKDYLSFLATSPVDDK